MLKHFLTFLAVQLRPELLQLSGLLLLQQLLSACLQCTLNCRTLFVILLVLQLCLQLSHLPLFQFVEKCIRLGKHVRIQLSSE